jgi:cell division protein YceG involved in septum cleavage
MKYQKLKLFQKTLLVVVVLLAAYIGNVVFFPRALPNKRFQIIINKDQNIHELAYQLEADNIIANR